MKELKARREELKIKQQDLADQLGISRTQLSRYENGLREADESIIEKRKGILFGLKFSDLEVGDYVYVRDDLVNNYQYGDKLFIDGAGGMKKGCLINVESIHHYCNCISNSRFLYTHEMLNLSRSMKKEDYLKMKEVKSNESFYELQEVAFQAYKDGLINNVAFENKLAPSFIRIDGNVIFDQHVSYKEDIDRLKSLYTEEFIIECEDDCKKIKQMAEITFLNGNSVVMDQPPSDDGIVRIWNDGRCDFVVLKGATVKQLKGVK